MNDMSRCLSCCELYQYVDVTVLLARHLNFSKSVEMLQRDATSLMDWYNKNSTGTNIGKSKLACFHNPHKTISLDRSLCLHSSQRVACNCALLECVSNIKYMGIYF